jgi:hypothetical protein
MATGEGTAAVAVIEAVKLLAVPQRREVSNFPPA